MSAGKVSRINLEKSKDPAAKTSEVGFKGLENSTGKASRVNVEDTKKPTGRATGVVRKSPNTNIGKTTGVQSKIRETLAQEPSGVDHEEPNVSVNKASKINPVGSNTSTKISQIHHKHYKNRTGEAPRVYSEVLKTPIKNATDVHHTTKMRVRRTTRFTGRALTVLHKTPKTPKEAPAIQYKNVGPLVGESSEVRECPKTPPGKASYIQIEDHTIRTREMPTVQLESSKPLTEDESKLQREDVKTLVGEESGVKREIRPQARVLSGIQCNLSTNPRGETSGHKFKGLNTRTGEVSTVQNILK